MKIGVDVKQNVVNEQLFVQMFEHKMKSHKKQTNKAVELA